MEDGCAVLDDDGEDVQRIWYRASERHLTWYEKGEEVPVKWKSPIHLPRCASRINTEITGLRVERLQSIDAMDAYAEGIDRDTPPDIAAAEYSALWERIHGAGSFDANPWVWVIEFKRLEGNHV